ncbi:uncharacterized protein SCHCODRAFT_02617817 [Schizophyllum commune H4-8]|uniref:uncharacterized protein n=1 Tax=Schizophyllum commune (strain H4-8 / FGSC 9210) TaxID=578458 RepID=UPI002160C33B|nr:uncharacterized protein SCHCODRAFT_02617817 [Schizophyllum commune H4-8]KAI5894798.1 hypothetical protein SCHCODRAFT_02617817 [Schizophyllum commune H4-8]
MRAYTRFANLRLLLLAATSPHPSLHLSLPRVFLPLFSSSPLHPITLPSMPAGYMRFPSPPLAVPPTGRWRSWLSHLSNTQKVLSSILGRLILP